MRRTMTRLLVCLAMASAVGCASDAEKICKRFKELMPDDPRANDPVAMAKCKVKTEKMLAKCGDKRASAVSCFKSASSKKELRGCAMVCMGDRVKRALAKLRHALKHKPSAGKGEFSGCPGSSECLNGCKKKCEGKHGALADVSAMRSCFSRMKKSGKSGADLVKACATAGINEPARRCFLACRGLPAH